MTTKNEKAKHALRNLTRSQQQLLDYLGSPSKDDPNYELQVKSIAKLRAILADTLETLSLWEGTDDLLERPINNN